jgi:hypothetical protein
VSLRIHIIAIAGFVLLALNEATPVHAQGFAIAVTPPRFELTVKPGERTRQVLELTNALQTATALTVRTADWKFAPNDTVVFDDALAPGSCRPWVAIERRNISVPGGGNFRYRFEIQPPPDAPTGECRFALMIEGDEQSVTTSGQAAVGVTARIGVIVYATIGDAKPKLDVVGAKVVLRNGLPVPVVEVTNTGNAHGRMTGFLSGKDGSGRDLEYDISTLPILPGETRSLELTARAEGNDPVRIVFPVTIRGKLEWGSESTPFERRFAE